MLSRMTDGVAQNSYHVKAMAADIRMRTRSTDKISKAAKSFKTGGVGRYARSGFVHIDLAHLGLGLRSSKIKLLIVPIH